MTIAAARAPISGLARRRDTNDRGLRTGTSDVGGAAEGSVTTDELMDCSWGGGAGGAGMLRWGGGSRGVPASPRSGLPGVVLRVGDDLVDFALVDDGRTRQHRPPTADVVAVAEVQPQRGDRHVALHVGLLVDGECDAAVLDLLGDVGVQVEGLDAGLAAGVGLRLLRGQRDVGAQCHDVGDRRVLLQLRPDGLLHRRQVPPVDVEDLGVGIALLHTRAPGLELDLPLLLDHADGLARSLLGDLPADRLSRERLVRPEVHADAVLRVGVLAGIEGDDRDPGRDRLLRHGSDRVWSGQRRRQAVHLAVDGVLDQRRLLACVRVIGVLQGDAMVLRGLLGAVPDLVPEGVAGRLVGHHGEGVFLPLGRVVLRTPLAAAGRNRQEGGHEGHQHLQPVPDSSHRVILSSCDPRVCGPPGWNDGGPDGPISAPGRRPRRGLTRYCCRPGPRGRGRDPDHRRHRLCPNKLTFGKCDTGYTTRQDPRSPGLLGRPRPQPPRCGRPASTCTQEPAAAGARPEGGVLARAGSDDDGAHRISSRAAATAGAWRWLQLTTPCAPAATAATLTGATRGSAMTPCRSTPARSKPNRRTATSAPPGTSSATDTGTTITGRSGEWCGTRAQAWGWTRPIRPKPITATPMVGRSPTAASSLRDAACSDLRLGLPVAAAA